MIFLGKICAICSTDSVPFSDHFLENMWCLYSGVLAQPTLLSFSIISERGHWSIPPSPYFAAYLAFRRKYYGVISSFAKIMGKSQYLESFQIFCSSSGWCGWIDDRNKMSWFNWPIASFGHMTTVTRIKTKDSSKGFSKFDQTASLTSSSLTHENNMKQSTPSIATCQKASTLYL